MVVLITSRLPDLHRTTSWTDKDAVETHVTTVQKSMEEYLTEVREAFTPALDVNHLRKLSSGLQHDLTSKLHLSDISMLPSYHHTLPTGLEKGTFVALDVGGSNFRIALIDLHGSGNVAEEEQMHLRHSLCFPIDASIKALKGKAFFSWMADRIDETLSSSGLSLPTQGTLSMGLAWSFPIEQTSARSGFLLAMGKGFSAVINVQGEDLGELLMEPCRALGLNVELCTIVNDSSATLLSQAYRERTTRMSVILGTGVNSSIYLPVSALNKRKFGNRPEEWHKAAQHVIVNTELSMHGKDVWPKTRWDELLNDEHSLPDFQPFEHFVGGRYLGEVARLVLLGAIEEAGFLGGRVPPKLSEAYKLESSHLALFESESESNLTEAGAQFATMYELDRDLTLQETRCISEIVRLVSTRAAAYVAAAIHALWCLRNKYENQHQEATKTGGPLSNGLDLQIITNGTSLAHDYGEEQVVIACNGSILEKYPDFRKHCQTYLDRMTSRAHDAGRSPDSAKAGVQHDTNKGERLIELHMARDSSMYGAAVAAACCGSDG